MVLIYILLGIGVAFNGLGSLALLRFPDIYTRLHGATKCTTFGSIFTTVAVIAYGFLMFARGELDLSLPVHATVALISLLLTNPTGAHAIARAAHRSGILPKKAVVDKLEEAGK
jgi:multicomponent Na+:H+ antiporter subunit G